MQTENENIVDMPSYNHSLLQTYLAAVLVANYRHLYHILSQPTLQLGDWESEPDLAIFPKKTINWHLDEIKIKEIPPVIIEIISPKQGGQDIMEKFAKYFQTGVKSCWLINPLEATILIYSPDWKRQVFADNSKPIHDPTLNISINFDEVFS